jgi:hypothetical protein
MEEKLEKLKSLHHDIGVMISFLEGFFYKKQLHGNGTIAEQMACYNDEGEIFTDIFNSIINEHGSEPCPFDDQKNF